MPSRSKYYESDDTDILDTASPLVLTLTQAVTSAIIAKLKLKIERGISPDVRVLGQKNK